MEVITNDIIQVALFGLDGFLPDEAALCRAAVRGLQDAFVSKATPLRKWEQNIYDVMPNPTARELVKYVISDGMREWASDLAKMALATTSRLRVQPVSARDLPEPPLPRFQDLAVFLDTNGSVLRLAKSSMPPRLLPPPTAGGGGGGEAGPAFKRKNRKT